MNPTGPVHFIHLGGELRWQHWRAVETAKVHGAPIWWHHADGLEIPPVMSLRYRRDFNIRDEVHVLDLPDWLRDHPIQLANIKDLYAWRILHEHGGMYLDLDTISLRPAWDLLPDDADLLVSDERGPGEKWHHPYNSAVVIGRKYAPILETLVKHTTKLLELGEVTWGAVGPHLLTEYRDWPELAAAPFPALNGWSYYTINDYYANPRDPGEPCRVIHLYSSDHPEWLEDRWMPQT